MCGIFGCINTVAEPLDKTAFNLLGILNDERGGDSCGVFIDGKLEIGAEKHNKLYRDFFYDCKALNSKKPVNVAIGHCRKASVGAINANTAQPIVIKGEDDKVDFVLIHNGTISNWRDLNKKYLVNTPDYFTDSYVMAHIFYYHGYDVLEEYEGGGVFVTIDYRNDRNNPEVFFFKGQSLQYRSSDKIIDERPLYINANKNNLWFSSMFLGLAATKYMNSLVNVKGNTLYKYHKGKLSENSFYDRSKKIQVGSYYERTNNYADGWGSYDYDTQRHFDNHSHTISENRTGKMIYPTGTNAFTLKEIMDKHIPSVAPFDRVIYSDDCLFRSSGKKLHGELQINLFGYKMSAQSYYFFQGHWVKNKKAFNILIDLVNIISTDQESFSGFSDAEDLSILFPELMRKYSVLPIYDERRNVFETEDTLGDPVLYTGSMIIPFNSDYITLNIKNGHIKSYTKGYYLNYADELDKLRNSSDKFDYDEAIHIADALEYCYDMYGSDQVTKIS